VRPLRHFRSLRLNIRRGRRLPTACASHGFPESPSHVLRAGCWGDVRATGHGRSMTGPEQVDPIADFDEVLSEVIETIFDVKQACRKAVSAPALHDELVHVFDDLVTWKTLLNDRDEAMGVSALTYMPSAAGRTPVNLWPGNATFNEVLIGRTP
jgi:hypothetical protein